MAYPKKYLQISSNPQKYQDFNATKNASNAEHTDIHCTSKLLVVCHKYDFYNIY